MKEYEYTLRRLEEQELNLRALRIAAANEAGAKMRDQSRRGIPGCLYLYYAASTETEWGKLRFFARDGEAPPDYMLASAEPLRGHVPYSHFYGWVCDRTNSIPIIAGNA